MNVTVYIIELSLFFNDDNFRLSYRFDRRTSFQVFTQKSTRLLFIVETPQFQIIFPTAYCIIKQIVYLFFVSVCFFN